MYSFEGNITVRFFSAPHGAPSHTIFNLNVEEVWNNPSCTAQPSYPTRMSKPRESNTELTKSKAGNNTPKTKQSALRTHPEQETFLLNLFFKSWLDHLRRMA
jgi:hypothetical protein